MTDENIQKQLATSATYWDVFIEGCQCLCPFDESNTGRKRGGMIQWVAIDPVSG